MSKSYSKIKGHFTSSNGITKIAYYIYRPASEPVAVIQIVHGIGEFIERYEEFAEFMCSHSVAVFGCDHIGHGGSVKCEQDKGYFYTDNGWRDMIADCRTMSVIGRKHFGNVPYIMYGFSMGSCIARAAVTKFGSDIDCVILSGTGSGMLVPTAKVAMIDMIEKAQGGRYRSEFLYKLAFGKYNMRVDNPKTQSDWLTRDYGEVLKFLEDPRRAGLMTVNGFKNLIKLYDYVSSDRWYASVNRSLPILMMSGEDDPVGEWGKGVSEVYNRLKACGCNVALKIYNGGRHDMLHETNRQEVFEDILNALGKTLDLNIKGQNIG